MEGKGLALLSASHNVSVACLVIMYIPIADAGVVGPVFARRHHDGRVANGEVTFRDRAGLLVIRRGLGSRLTEAAVAEKRPRHDFATF